MNKMDLTRAVAGKVGMSLTDTKAVLNVVLEEIIEGMKNDGKVALTGFGSFEVRERAERTGRNPQTGEEIVIPAVKAPKFKAGKSMKEAVR